METIGEDLRQMIRTPLARSHVEALRAAGKVTTYPKGTFMVQQGERVSRFVSALGLINSEMMLPDCKIVPLYPTARKCPLP